MGEELHRYLLSSRVDSRGASARTIRVSLTDARFNITKGSEGTGAGFPALSIQHFAMPCLLCRRAGSSSQGRWATRWH
jgi:hypothetical protein